jgi:hypothetical protein
VQQWREWRRRRMQRHEARERLRKRSHLQLRGRANLLVRRSSMRRGHRRRWRLQVRAHVLERRLQRQVRDESRQRHRRRHHLRVRCGQGLLDDDAGCRRCLPMRQRPRRTLHLHERTQRAELTRG